MKHNKDLSQLLSIGDLVTAGKEEDRHWELVRCYTLETGKMGQYNLKCGERETI